MVHLSTEELSALLDGEFAPAPERRAREHLGECPSCSAAYALNVRLDDELRQPPSLSCDQLVELLSAAFDHQADDAEGATVQRHLSTCERCPETLSRWAALSGSLRGLPRVAPSARVDRAIRELVAPRRVRRPARVNGFAARALIALTAVLAVVVAGVGTGRPGPSALLPPADRVLVASAQQIVFNARNNTVYVLDAPGAAVDAREPSTNELKTRILVGGAPTALALNEVANTVLVLDASQKRVTEIDAASNTVIGATTVALTGTPTSISVDQGKIIVATVSTPKSTSESPSGSVAVINSSTKQLETVREINLAPRLVVPDQRSGRSVVMSADTTTLVDSSYKVLATLPGGVSAAFSRVGDVVAIFSPSGPDAVVNFVGGSAPLPVRLPGAPRAMASLPDGGYLVLVEAGGRGRVSKITRDGVVAGTVEVVVTGGDLVYDETSNRFAVANAGRVDYGEIPTQIAIVATPSPQSPSPAAGQSPSPSPTATASPSASGSPEAQVASSGRPASANPTPNILEHARLVSSGIYNLALPTGVRPQLATTSGSRVWMIDQANGVDSFDMNTGEFVNFGKLRADAHPSFWVAGASYVFAVDAGGQIHVVNVARGRVDAYSTNFPSPISAAAVGTDDRLWFGLRNASYLMAFDPRTLLMQEFDLAGAKVSALAVDQGRIYYADDQRGTVGMVDPHASKFPEVGFAKSGATTALMVDATSTLWLGTSAGEIYSVRGGRAELTVSLQRPVTAFAADQSGHAWYLAPLPSGLSGYAYGPADGSQTPRSVSGPALNLSFNPLGRAFLTDPQGGMYVSTEGGR